MSHDDSAVQSTYKSKDTEEFIDILFYRPVGYVLALASKSLGLTPNTVTILSIFVGIAAGHMFFYNDLLLNTYGVLLLIFANAMDSADGQLARITNNKTRLGRILDGLAGNLWFVSIYLHLTFRLIDSGISPYIFFLIVVAGLSHSFQSAYADYFRNYYLMFVYGKDKSEVDESERIKKEYKEVSWIRNFYKKFLMRVYLNYTIQQEYFSKQLLELYNFVKTKLDLKIPSLLSEIYRDKNKSLIKYFNILTTNTRMIVLFIAVYLREPFLYFFFELTALNILFIYVVIKHEHNSKKIYEYAAKTF